jgi:hypothetical protein
MYHQKSPSNIIKLAVLPTRPAGTSSNRSINPARAQPTAKPSTLSVPGYDSRLRFIGSGAHRNIFHHSAAVRLRPAMSPSFMRRLCRASFHLRRGRAARLQCLCTPLVSVMSLKVLAPLIGSTQIQKLLRCKGNPWSGRRVSNPQHPAWKASALPIELLPPALWICYGLSRSVSLVAALTAGSENGIWTHLTAAKSSTWS